MKALPKKTKRILVVDDDEFIRDMVLTKLSRSGFDVTTAKNGTDALNLIETSRFDLVITDFQMPGMDGYALASSIQQDSDCTPVIMMTGHVDEIILQAKAEGCIDCLIQKPFQFKEIKAAIKDLLN